MSAHSKIDWSTGELLFFDYGDEPPFMTYGVADASGKLQHEVAIDLPGPRLPHDIGFTTNYAILHDLRVCWNKLMLTCILYRSIAFAMMRPVVAILLQTFVSMSGRTVLADEDIRFFFIKPLGWV